MCHKTEAAVRYRCAVAACVAIGVATIRGSTARAQLAPAQAVGSVYGYVIDQDGHALTGVEVFILDAPRRNFRSIGAGLYHIDSISPGPHLLGFRRLGSSPLTIPIDVKPNDITTMDARMTVLPHSLPVVVVRTSRGEYLQMTQDLAQRIRTGLGDYITYDDIERRRAVRTSDLLTGIAGVEVSGRGVYNTRGVSSINALTCNGGMPMYIDGTFAGFADPSSSPLDLVQPSDILAIEVYKSAVTMSAALPPSPCGGIFLWTKR